MRFTLIAGSAIFAVASPTYAAPERNCSNGTCRIVLTPSQLLVAAERLISERHYAEALPLVEALRLAPGFKLQTQFLGGLISSRTGDYANAANQFMAILANDPTQTRVRLELAHALIALKKTASADRQLRIVQQDTELPQQIARTIRTVRDTIRSGRTWRLDLNVGVAPDTNINNATSAQSITVLLGEDAYQADLNEEAKAHSGVGLTTQVSAGLRLPVSKKVSALAEIDANGSSYRSTQFDDYNVQTSAGAEYRLTSTSSVSFEGVYAHRWFGGKATTAQVGARTGGQMALGKRDRFGYQVDRGGSVNLDRLLSGVSA